VKWWNNTVEVNPSGDPFSKPAAGGKKAFEVYPVSEQGTSLLLHFNGTNGSTTFTDSSSNGLTVTANGDAEISTAESQFGGASGYFDGGGYLSIAANSAPDLSGADFCIELWAYPNALASTAALISQGLPDTIENCWSLEPSGSDIAFFASAGDPGQTIDLVLSGSLATGEWSHIAVTCESGTARLFINGALVDSASLSLASTAGTPLIVGAGWYDPAARGADCYIDELRITKGSAIYTAAFTPPASALTSTPLDFVPSGQFNSFDLSDNGLLQVRSEGVTLDSGDPAESGNISYNSLSSQALDQFYTDLDAGGGDLFVQGNPGIDGDDPTIATGKGYTVFGSVPPVTSLLLNFNGTNGSTVFTDSSPNSLTVTASGDAEISTAQSKYGGSSAYSDGAGSIAVAQGAWSDFSGSDYTVEFWYYRPSGASGAAVLSFGWQETGDFAPLLIYYDGGALDVYSDRGTWGTPSRLTDSLAGNTWHHVAVCGTAETHKGFLNGNLIFTATNLSPWASNANDFTLLSDADGASASKGYIDDLRIIKGQALYTGNFTPPKSAFPTGAADPHWSGVSLLLPMDADFDDASSNALTATANGDATISTARSVFGGASFYCPNSTSDFLDIAAPGNEMLFTGDYTIEAWVRFVELNNDMSLFYSYSEASGYHALNITPTEFNVYFQSISPDWSPSHSLPIDQWVHIAMVRSGSTVCLYQDGQLVASTTASGTHGYAAPDGARISNTGGNELYIDEFRITKGVARYTSNFTPPTAQLTVYP
jgi:hypothetical protein